MAQVKQRKWTEDEIQFLSENHKDYTLKELAEELNRTKSSVRAMTSKLKIKSKPELKEYAVYKGDEFLVLGTAEECAEFLDIKPNTVHYLASSLYYKRVESKNGFNNSLMAIKLEED